MEKFAFEALKAKGQTAFWYIAGGMTGGYVFAGLVELVTRAAAFVG